MADASYGMNMTINQGAAYPSQNWTFCLNSIGLGLDLVTTLLLCAAATKVGTVFQEKVNAKEMGGMVILDGNGVFVSSFTSGDTGITLQSKKSVEGVADSSYSKHMLTNEYVSIYSENSTTSTYAGVDINTSNGVSILSDNGIKKSSVSVQPGQVVVTCFPYAGCLKLGESGAQMTGADPVKIAQAAAKRAALEAAVALCKTAVAMAEMTKKTADDVWATAEAKLDNLLPTFMGLDSAYAAEKAMDKTLEEDAKAAEQTLIIAETNLSKAQVDLSNAEAQLANAPPEVPPPTFQANATQAEMSGPGGLAKLTMTAAEMKMSVPMATISAEGIVSVAGGIIKLG
jgi:hypothetical protein